MTNLPYPCGVESDSTLSVVHWVLDIFGIVAFAVLFIFLLINIILNIKNKQKFLNRRNIILFIFLILVIILVLLVNWIFSNFIGINPCG